jgi:hypothetical protein
MRGRNSSKKDRKDNEYPIGEYQDRSPEDEQRHTEVSAFETPLNENKPVNHNLISNQPKTLKKIPQNPLKKGSSDDNSFKAKHELADGCETTLGGSFLAGMQSVSNESSVTVSENSDKSKRSGKAKKTKKNSVLRRILKKL